MSHKFVTQDQYAAAAGFVPGIFLFFEIDD